MGPAAGNGRHRRPSSPQRTVPCVAVEPPDPRSPALAAEAELTADALAADSVTKNAGFAFGTQMTTAAITAGLTLFLGRALGPDGFGHYALALAIASGAAFLADLGINAATPRFVAERRGSRSAVAAVLGDSLRLKLLVSVPVCVALFALAGPISQVFDAPEAEWPLRGMAIAVLTQGVFLLVLGSFEALGRISINLKIVASESVVEAGAIVALVLLGGGAAGAAFGRGIGYAVGAGIALAFIWRIVGAPRARSGPASGVGPRDIAQYAGALLIIDGLFRLFREADVLLIAALVGGGAAVGLFELPMMLAWFLHYPVGAVSTAVAPRLARTADGRPPQVETFATALRYIIAFQGIFLAPIVVWAEPIVVTLLGAEYRESAQVLRALAPFVLLSGPAVLVSLGVNYLGEARRRIPLVIVVLLVNVVVDIVLIPEIGIVGGAIGTDLAYAIWVPAHLLIIQRLLALSLRPFALAFGRSIVAAAIASVPLVLLGTDVGILLLLAGGAIASIVYVGSLLLTGELSRSDLDLMRDVLGRRFPSLRPNG